MSKHTPVELTDSAKKKLVKAKKTGSLANLKKVVKKKKNRLDSIMKQIKQSRN